jgi:hypothetical protein
MKTKPLTFLLALTFLFFGSIGESFAQPFYYRCQDDEKFQKNFIIDPLKKTILHKSSFDHRTDRKYDVEKNQKISDWKYEESQMVWFLGKSSKTYSGTRGHYYTLYAMDFKNNTLLQAAILPESSSKDRMFQSYISKCYKD